MTNRITARLVAGALLMTAVFTATPALAQQVDGGLAAALASDVAEMSEKFVGLARVMDGKYDWRPGQGVRSVGEVFNLIVEENQMLAGLLTGRPAGGGFGSSKITASAPMQEALRTSYAALRTTLAGLSEADLRATVQMFGRPSTKQAAALGLLFDQHEHLGQSIAYARTNGIAPPWAR